MGTTKMGKGAGKGGDAKATQVMADGQAPAWKPKQRQTEVLVDGVLYNVEGFKHPGGSIINFYGSPDGPVDASEAWHAFHMRSPKAMKMMKALPHKAAPAHMAKKDPLVEDFIKFRESLQEEGFFEPDSWYTIYRFAELVAMHVIGLSLVYRGGLPSVIAGLVILGLASGRCGWYMHEGGHYSLTGHIPTDQKIQSFAYGLGCGMSASFWRNQHNKHHATPQKVKHDVDLDTLPLVAFNSAVLKRAPNWWISMQAYLFAPLTCLLVALGWQFFLHPRHSLRTGKYDELFWYGTRYLLWSFAFGDFSVGASIAAYLFYDWVGASYIFCNFAVSHTHRDVVAPDEHVNWVVYAANHTTNCCNHWFTNWWMAYLNFQIEHHLFPSMPQYRHAIIAPRVKALFEKHGVVYDDREYLVAMKDTMANLHKVGNPNHDH